MVGKNRVRILPTRSEERHEVLRIPTFSRIAISRDHIHAHGPKRYN